MTQKEHIDLIVECVVVQDDLDAMLNLPPDMTPGREWCQTVNYLECRLQKIEQRLSEKRLA